MDAYPGNMMFRMRLMPEPEGVPRPQILDLDWNKDLDPESQFQRMIAIGTISRTRIFVRLKDDAVINKTWQMIYNIHHPAVTRSKALRWNPNDWKILAVGSDDGASLIIEIVQWTGERFKKFNKVDVKTKGRLESVCWNSRGDYLLATLGPIEGRKSTMVAIKHPTRSDCMKYIVDTGYKGSYFALFQPLVNFIVSCATEISTLSLWTENESNEWIKARSVRIGGPLRKMSFSVDGRLLAGIGDSLRIWECEPYDPTDIQSALKLSSMVVQSEDGKRRNRGATLRNHCLNLISVFVCSEEMILTGSSEGSMCLHAFHQSTHKSKKSFKVRAFRYSDIQVMGYKGEICCVQETTDPSQLVAVGGSDGIVTIWEYVEGQPPRIERNTNLEIYRYEPKYQSIDESVNLDKDGCESVTSVLTERNNDLELLLTVKATLGALKTKQNDVQKLLQKADKAVKLGAEAIEVATKNLESAKVKHEELNTSFDGINQLLEFM